MLNRTLRDKAAQCRLALRYAKIRETSNENYLYATVGFGCFNDEWVFDNHYAVDSVAAISCLPKIGSCHRSVDTAVATRSKGHSCP
jgi:hypothetical protein